MSKFFEIHDEDFTPLQDKIVVVTGCASGIGLATTELLLAHGAKVTGADLNPPPITHDNLTFQRTDVSSWTDLTHLFDIAREAYGGRIDHVFANAGIGSSDDFISLKTDPSTGKLLEPSHRTFDVDLRAPINTAALAFHYMRTQSPPGGSVVLTASASSFQRFVDVDYTSAKHGVLGFMRGMVTVMAWSKLPIRVNAIGPAITQTGILPPGLEIKSKPIQAPSAVARGVALLMADEARTGHFIYTVEGKHMEIDEAILIPTAMDKILNGVDDNVIIEEVREFMRKSSGS